jgi:hypothetical protein
MCDHVEYLKIDCGNEHCSIERTQLQYTLQAVIFTKDMWKQYSLQHTLQAVIFPADLHPWLLHKCTVLFSSALASSLPHPTPLTSAYTCLPCRTPIHSCENEMIRWWIRGSYRHVGVCAVHKFGLLYTTLEYNKLWLDTCQRES